MSEGTQTSTPDASRRGAWWAIWCWALHWQILIGLVIGAILGILSGYTAVQQFADVEGGADMAREALKERWDFLLYALFGDLFLNGLKLIIVPIVTSSLIVSVAGIGGNEGFARMGVKTLLYYLATSFLAIVVGLVAVNVIQPGVTDPDNPVLTTDEPTQLEQFAGEQNELTKKTEGRKTTDFLDTFRRMIPPNFIKAAADGQLLGLIVVSLLIGFFMTRLEGRPREVMFSFWKAVYELALMITDLVLRFAPIGVAALLAKTLSDSFATLYLDDRLADFVTVIVKFFITTCLALGVHFCITMPLILYFVAGVKKPWRHYHAMAPALMTAFSTASSSATLPVSIECVEERAGVSNRTASFVLPLGATVNMDGTALYECVAAMFIAQCYGIELGLSQQFFIVLVALLTSVGVAGVPSASLVAIVIILKSVGVPMDGLAIILVVDRLLDMCRTAVNIFGDSCGAVVVASSEGETGLLERRGTRP